MVTRRRKLRTDGSLWQHLRAPRVPYRALLRDQRTDVLIVGGGITGAMIAEMLAEAGLDVVGRPAHADPRIDDRQHRAGAV